MHGQSGLLNPGDSGARDAGRLFVAAPGRRPFGDRAAGLGAIEAATSARNGRSS